MLNINARLIFQILIQYQQVLFKNQQVFIFIQTAYLNILDHKGNKTGSKRNGENALQLVWKKS